MAKPFRAAIGFVIAVTLIWWFYPFVLAKVVGTTKWPDLGQFGDMYGALNTLFSGLAFAAVISALLLQHRELEDTQRAVKDAELSRKKEHDADSFLRLSEFIEATRGARTSIRSWAREGRPWHQLDPQKELPMVDELCRAFDRLALLDRLQLVDSRLVDLFYAVPFVELYEDYLEEYVSHLRAPSNRGATHYWELVQFYDRVRHVPEWHPGKNNDQAWPADPRRKNPGKVDADVLVTFEK